MFARRHPRLSHAVLFVITSDQKHQMILRARSIDKMGNYKAGKMMKLCVWSSQTCGKQFLRHVGPPYFSTCVHRKMWHTKWPFAICCKSLFCLWIYTCKHTRAQTKGVHRKFLLIAIWGKEDNHNYKEENSDIGLYTFIYPRHIADIW